MRGCWNATTPTSGRCYIKRRWDLRNLQHLKSRLTKKQLVAQCSSIRKQLLSQLKIDEVKLKLQQGEPWCQVSTNYRCICSTDNLYCNHHCNQITYLKPLECLVTRTHNEEDPPWRRICDAKIKATWGEIPKLAIGAVEQCQVKTHIPG